MAADAEESPLPVARRSRTARGADSPGGFESAYIGLGSNLDDPQQQIRTAISALSILPHSRLRRHSPLYRTAPLGPPGQPDYVNAAALLETALEPMELLDALLGVERDMGRRRDGERWGPRIIDLDLLLYGSRRMQHERLRLPHSQLHRRAFVLIPLADIAGPDLGIPGQGTLGRWLARCDAANVACIP